MAMCKHGLYTTIITRIIIYYHIGRILIARFYILVSELQGFLQLAIMFVEIRGFGHM